MQNRFLSIILILILPIITSHEPLLRLKLRPSCAGASEGQGRAMSAVQTKEDQQITPLKTFRGI
jgi:hypothetical protein